MDAVACIANRGAEGTATCRANAVRGVDGEDCLKLRSPCTGRNEFRSRAEARLSAVEAQRLSRTGHSIRTFPSHTGHTSSFQAISQNIHSYLELMRKAASKRSRSLSVTDFAHASTFRRIQRPTSANSGEA